MAGLGAEMFTVLATITAIDRASAEVKKVVGAYDNLTGALDKAATTAKAAGEQIDMSVLQTASDADALSLAMARVEGAQANAALATDELANAERNLLDAQAQAAAAADGDAKATQRLAVASDEYAAAQKRAADAAATVRDAQAGQKTVQDALAASQGKLTAQTDKAGIKLSSVAGAVGKFGLGMAVAGGLMVHAAGDFESSTTHLTTDAGEVKSQLGKVQAGMLQIGDATGTTATQLSAGMYHIESSLPQIGNAADRANKALEILKISAEGAKVGNADLDTVSKALVGTMNAYATKGYTATQMMNALISTVGAGDMKMQDLASGLGNVAPLAAAVGISFDQVGGAIAVMTSQNMSADQAMQDLANTIRSLSNPSNIAIQQMQELGVSSQDIQMNLGKRGLTGTLDVLTQALANHTHNGKVFIDTLKNSQVAAANLKQAMDAMPPSMRKMAEGLLNGSITAAEWTKATKDMPLKQQTMAKQFLAMGKQADSFNQLLKSGKPGTEAFQQALANMMGGATGLNTALMLTGPNMATYQANVDKIGASLRSKSKDVENWSTIQGTFNQKMDRAKVAVENTGIAIGTALLPAVSGMASAAMKVLQPLASWAAGHQHLAAIIFGSLAGLAALVGVINLGVKAFNAVRNAVNAVRATFMAFGKVLGLVKAEQEGAAVASTEVAAAEDAQAVSTDAATVSTEANTVATNTNNVSMLTSVGMLARAAFGFAALKVAQFAQAAASKAVTAAQWLMNAAMEANPIGIVIALIAGLVAGFIYLWNHSKAFRDFWIGLWHDIQKIIGDVVDWIKGHWRLLIAIIGGPIGLAVALVTKYWHDIVQYTMDFVHGVQAVLNWFGSLPGKFGQWFDDVKNAAIGKLVDLGNWLIGLPGRILNWIGDLGSLLYNVGKSILQGLWNGMKDMWNSMTGWIGSIGNWISNLKGPIEVDAVLLTPHGHKILQGLMKGMKAEMPALQAQLGGITATIQSRVSAPNLPVTAGGGGGGGGGVYVDLRGSQVMTERDMDVLLSKLGRALAVRVAPQAGLRVAM